MSALARFTIAEEESATRRVACRTCGAGICAWCLAGTGLAASSPCPVRLADAFPQNLAAAS